MIAVRLMGNVPSNNSAEKVYQVIESVDKRGKEEGVPMFWCSSEIELHCIKVLIDYGLNGGGRVF